MDLYFDYCLEIKSTSFFLFTLKINSDREAFIIFSLFIAIYYTIHASSIAFVRIFTNKIVPYKGEENYIVLCLNRIISNTTEQLIVFCSLLYAINQLSICGEWMNIQLIRFFMLGRVLFSIGYLFGEITHFPYLRSIGFVCTIMPALKMFVLIFSSREFLFELEAP